MGDGRINKAADISDMWWWWWWWFIANRQWMNQQSSK
jgi:hypothetical protein